MRIAFLALLCSTAFALSPSVGRAAEILITEAEASLPSDDQGTTRGVTRGPAITQVSPNPDAGKSVQSPLPFKIRFQTRNNVPIDKDSIKLTYLRKPSVDLTGRIKKHIADDGIDMQQAEVPPGHHAIRIELKDQQGRSTASTIRMTVVR